MMKRSKKVLLAVSSFLFAACIGSGVGLVKTPVNAAPLTTANGLADLDVSQAGTKGVAVGNVANNYLVVNKQLGGDAGVHVDIELDVTFTQNANDLSIGMVPTIDKASLAAANKSGQGLPSSDFDYYYFDGSNYVCWAERDNGWLASPTPSVQKALIGQVKLKLSVGAYGDHTIYLYVPSSNTQIDASVERDTWITFGSEGSGLFAQYSTLQNLGHETGYVFFSMKNVIYNSVTFTNGSNSPSTLCYSDDFSDPTTFATNYVTNDAFDNAVSSGAITLPKRLVSVTNSTASDVKILANQTAAPGLIYSTKKYKGAMRVEILYNGYGPTASFGFLVGGKNIYAQTNLTGMKISKDGTLVYNQFDDSLNGGSWGNVLNEPTVTGIGGDVKFIVDINEQGDATFSIDATGVSWLRAGSLSKTFYEVTTVDGLFADLVNDGGTFIFSTGISSWGHEGQVKDVKLTDKNGNVLLADDFSYNNFNGNGEDLWTVDNSNNAYVLPGISQATFNGGVAYVTTQNTATETESLKVTYNAQVISGAMQYYFGMSEKDTSTATAYVTAQDGNLTVTQGSVVTTLASGVDFTATTQITLDWNNAQDRLYAYVNGERVGSAAMLVDVTGYMGIYGDNVKMGYLNAETVVAQSAVTTQAGAYVKANTTLNNSGMRFASVLDKTWYDAVKADATVTAVTYGTLIVPTDYLDEISSFTLEGLQASGKNYINAVVTNGFTNQDTAESDGYYQYMGGIKNILPANYTRNFSAIGYVTVTYAGVGAKTYYGGYNDNDNSRNIYQLAGRTYGDRKAEQQGKYTYQLEDGTWAQYSQEVMNVMKAYLDSVVNVTVNGDTVNYVAVNEYYEKAYSVTKDGNVLTITSNVKFDTVVINGVRQQNVSVTENNGTFTASVEV